MHKKLHTPAPGTEYALGWGVESHGWAGGRALTHVGSNAKWMAVVWLAPERDFGMLAVTNAGTQVALDAVNDAIDLLIDRFEAVSR